MTRSQTRGSKSAVASSEPVNADAIGPDLLTGDQVIETYNARLPALRSLVEEVRFTIDDALATAGISVSSLESRLKELKSTLKKVEDKSYADFDQITDIVGARIICMFRSDLDAAKSAMESCFDIIEYDDKSISDPASFGYMSLHLLAKIKSEYEGPRYGKIKNQIFEIQIRTICMHAWSSIQHSLEYKGFWDVPISLKKDINALSALFYLADTQFAAVFAAKTAEFAKAVENSSGLEGVAFNAQELDFETLTAYAESKFPSRSANTKKADVSKLVNEIKMANINTIGELDRQVSRGIPAMEADENKRGSSYNIVGAVRVSLSYASKTYHDITYPSGPISRPFMDMVIPE
ncbi:GTP pyrophosphokinase [Sphingomonas sp. CFBP 8760]|uniref:GTP pyrophosphokinase n=1 Tax=Sphingomonas sp. CFBP 8760 TaxID=2775282 RepID=UPI00177DF112|nr:hypothetical protein [Sphingomonas sp. CFBP 8760]MBD8549015.1 hypothetical protein [Sphingomonas sp. CFBP 8760]